MKKWILGLSKERELLPRMIFLGLLAGLLLVLGVYWLEILFAGIVALGLVVVVEKIKNRSSTLGKISLWFFLFVLPIFILFFCGYAISRFYRVVLIEQRDQILQRFSKMYESLESTLHNSSMAQSFGIKSSPSTLEYVKEKAMGLATGAASVIASIPDGLLRFFVFYIFLFLFMRSKKEIFKFLIELQWVTEEKLSRITEVLQKASYEVIASNLIIGVVQATLITIASAAVGFNELAIIFQLTLICSFSPVIGAGPMGVAIAGLLYMEDQTGGAIAMLVVSLVAGTIDNVMRPYLVSNSSKSSSSLVALVVIFGGIEIFGFLGIFLGPFFYAAIIEFWSEDLFTAAKPDTYPKT